MADDARDAAPSTSWAEDREACGRVPPVDLDRGGEWLAPLVRTIERDVIPRMMLSHRSAARAAPATASERIPDQQDVEQLGDIVLADDRELALAFVASVEARGISVESIYLGLLAPTARHLGELWSADRCDFTQVTIGLWCLQSLLHHLGTASHFRADDTSGGEHDRSVLVAPTPGEQHTFGLAMVSEFFRRAHWQVRDAVGATSGELGQIVGGDWFGIIGLSLSSDRHLDRLRDAIALVRRKSLNPRVLVMVGGRVFHDQPALVDRIGADATACDGRQAVVEAQRMLAARALPL